MLGETIATPHHPFPRAELDMTDCDGKTALHLSCSEGHYDVVVQLLRAGANVNLVNLQVEKRHMTFVT